MESKNGFTLIELLVTVVIIGILAAVALPQYQKAVERTRATEAVSILNGIQKALDSYFVKYDKYPGNENNGKGVVDGLSNEIEIPIICDLLDEQFCRSKYFVWKISCNNHGCAFVAGRIKNPESIESNEYQNNTEYDLILDSNALSPEFTYKICLSRDTSIGQSVCQSLESQGLVNQQN